MLQCNCSICGEENSRDAFLIDPGDETERILSTLDRIGLKTRGILLTHAHIDHTGAVAALQQITGAPVHLHPDDSDLAAHAATQAAMTGLPSPERFKVQKTLTDGDVLELGDLKFHVLHTPGHSPGSVCFWVPSEKILFSGDTLFRGSIGRTDLPGGDGRRILDSIREKLLPLPDETRVFPGHGPGTTMEQEKWSNPFLQRL